MLIQNWRTALHVFAAGISVWLAILAGVGLLA